MKLSDAAKRRGYFDEDYDLKIPENMRYVLHIYDDAIKRAEITARLAVQFGGDARMSSAQWCEATVAAIERMISMIDTEGMETFNFPSMPDFR